jgi:hypothetical protein
MFYEDKAKSADHSGGFKQKDNQSNKMISTYPINIANY